MNPQARIINLKHQLLGALLEKPSKYWTDEELDLAELLSKDSDIQKTLEAVRKKK